MNYPSILLLLLGGPCYHVPAFVIRQSCFKSIVSIPTLAASVESKMESEAISSALSQTVLEHLAAGASAAKEYADSFGLSESNAGFYGLFDSMRKANIAYGFQGHPFVLRKSQIQQALGFSPFKDFFTMNDLEKAVEDDFLDAARGSTDNRKGWMVRKID